MSAKRWFGWTITLAAAICLLVGSFNFVVDPWDLNGEVSIEGFNKLKPDPLTIVRLHKAYDMVRLRPSAVAMGTSTAEHAISMQHPSWRNYGTVYNFSLPGATIEEITTFLQEAQRISPVKRAVIGLDLFSFNANRVPNAQSAQAIEAMRSPLERAKPYFTRGMLAASLDTLLRQPFLFEYFLPSGQSSEDAFEQWRIKLKGHHNLFVYNTQQTVRDLLPKPAYRFELQRGTEPSTLEQLRQLLEFARKQGIDLQLYISPAHAWQLETIRAMGLWPIFEYWKQQVALTVAPYSSAPQNGARVTLWDFADYNALTTEDLPKPNDVEAKMRWFWDAQHFKTGFGDLIQDRMSGMNAPVADIPEGLGVRLDAQNLTAQLLAVREHQKQYRESHPKDVAAVEKIVAIAMKSLHAD